MSSDEFKFLLLLSDGADVYERGTTGFCPRSQRDEKRGLVKSYVKCYVYRWEKNLDIYIKPISSRNSTKVRRISENALLFSQSLQDRLPSVLVDKKVLVRGENMRWEYYPATLLKYDERYSMWKIEDIFGRESWQHLKNLFLIDCPNLETSEKMKINYILN